MRNGGRRAGTYGSGRLAVRGPGAVLARGRLTVIALSAVMLLTFFYFFVSTTTDPRLGIAGIAKSLQHTAKPMNSRKLGGQAVAMRYDMRKVNATGLPEQNQERVLILTPMARFLPEYWENLLRLDYPRDLIELGFIVPRDAHGRETLKALEAAAHAVQTGPANQRYSDVNILLQDFESPVSTNEQERHALAAQKKRRSAMALARNSLMWTLLKPYTSWVLWLDADIIETPPHLIQDLAAHNKPIIVANCYQRYRDDNGKAAIRPYDWNNWHESQAAIDLASRMSEDDIILEGYAELPTWRLLFGKEYQEHGDKNHIVELDGVGGTTLLVKAEVHRDGAMFPTFPFYHLIETEGFARMARRLNYQAYGLPNYLVYHYND